MSYFTRLSSVAASLIVAAVLVFSATAFTPDVASAQGASDNDAIMDVVLGFNQSTVDATEARDPEPVREFTTDDLYREIALDMRADWSAGVTAIELVDLEWGTISVDGSSATAYTVETWNVTLANGSSGEMPPTINLYTLVLDDGAWKVESNEHPGSEL